MGTPRSHGLATTADGVSGLLRRGIPPDERPGRHLRLDSLSIEPSTNARKLDELLIRDEVSGHDFVYGELLIGDKVGRKAPLADYERMDQATSCHSFRCCWL